MGPVGVSQTILFTVIPHGITINSDTLPVSVYVSPRLYGATNLSSFPDWLKWTRILKESGMSLTFKCSNQELTQSISTEPLRPELWEAMFKEGTLVKSHTFADYSDRTIFSYPVRLALSVLKSIYQQSGVNLGLPDRNPPDEGETERGSRLLSLLKGLINGLQVNWDENSGEKLRARLRAASHSFSTNTFGLQYQPAQLGSDGLLKDIAQPGTNQVVAQQFAVFHHMPPGIPIEKNPPDFDTLLDFHQALSSLNSYSELMRALGLVLDLDLPREFVSITPINQPGSISISAVPDREWAVPTTVPLLETAYFYTNLGEMRMFLTAPGFSVQRFWDLDTFGLLNLNPVRFGLAQVDVDGATHKAIILAETLQDGNLGPAMPPHPDVFDPTATLPALRSVGLSLFADSRSLKLLSTFKQSKAFNDALEAQGPQPHPFYAEDLLHGYRLDIWDSHTNIWHSLHRRNGVYQIGEETFETRDEEGFVQLAVTQASPNPDNPPPNDLYLHEAIARWAGWSLSAPMPGRHLTRHADPDKAVNDPNQTWFEEENEPATPFKMKTNYKVVSGSLPSLRFGRRYRLRARVVDLCGNSLGLNDSISDTLSQVFGLPQDPEGFAYLRYEPVAAPVIVLRDARALTDPGSAIDRIVIRTFNSAPSKDLIAADRSASDRHIAPPRTSVEMGERLGMFDDESGGLIKDPALWELIKQRDAGEFNEPPQPMVVAGKEQTFPLEPDDRLDQLPYLPDPLARGAALRDLPGTPSGTVGAAKPGVGQTGPVLYTALNDPNPRPGSATLISFGGVADWKGMRPFRLALDEGDHSPVWDPVNRVLTVFLPKGATKVVPLSSYITSEDLKLMGVWQWIREHIESITVASPQPQFLQLDRDVDQIAHILQRVVEGGHWMLTPPHLLTLVHAVQQPIGVPVFTALTVQHEPYGDPTEFPYDVLNPNPDVLQTEPERVPTSEVELATITAWRKPGSVEAYLMGGLKVHGASTAKIDLLAQWDDPVDDPNIKTWSTERHSAQADEVPLSNLREGFIIVNAGKDRVRRVAYYKPDHDMLCFVRAGDKLGQVKSGVEIYQDAAPRHHFNDTKYHSVSYTARATSRYRDYFPQDQNLGFFRTSAPVVVDVPASARPAAPQILYIIPAFSWQRQTHTNLKRSVRFGGGLRVYLERPWFSSGEGELLGVALYSMVNYTLDRDKGKPFITQWGVDPIWQTSDMEQLPSTNHFPGAVVEHALSLEERTPLMPDGKAGRVDVVGYPVQFDEERKLWYCDITVNTYWPTYTPFLRLALVRYQPHALPDAKLSRVVLADFVQLTPDRSAVVTADPYHSRRLRVTVSGPAPQGPIPVFVEPPPTDPVKTPTQITITVQQRDPAIVSDLVWTDVLPEVAKVSVERSGATPEQPDLILWSGIVEFAQPPQQGQFRLVIKEYEYISANYTITHDAGEGQRTIRQQPGRLIYAEVIEVDSALSAEPLSPTTGAGDPEKVGSLPPPADPPWDPISDRPLPEALDYSQLPQLELMEDPNQVDGFVKLAQAMLNAAGALPPLIIDGKYGPLTQKAVQAFQTSHFLDATGVIDQRTWFALMLAAPFPLLEPGPKEPPMQGPPIAMLQQTLNMAGAHPRLEISGVFDPQAQSALTDFQNQRGLPTIYPDPVTGIPTVLVDPSTWLALADVPGAVAPTGAMRLTFAYDSDWWEAQETPVQLVSREDDEALIVPPSEDLDDRSNMTGFWAEWQDEHGQSIYRRTFYQPIRLVGEILSIVSPLDHPRGSFVLEMPILSRARTLALFSSPLDVNRSSEAATLIASFDVTNL